MVMVVGETSMELDQCFQMTMMNMEGVSIKEWKDIPVELLMRILPLVDDRNVIAASGVCSGWRDAISLGLTRLRLSCSDLSSLHLSKMTTLESLKFEPLEAFSDKAIAYLTRSCRNLLLGTTAIRCSH
ncbi:PREDICTED: F-box protein SKP2A-like isoform X2 [Brassica oleracea var. oleracea]|uniref:F-box protein SKP2A-like isoform X2 n=1 Tax=Brassica oleracea var. oleracea TaxID=109376 RepID=UPI0006A7556A|nr:PREDICTED: F-box protein SKP2A-like isoform X2 [Brassica oleracea var. oleracea]